MIVTVDGATRQMLDQAHTRLLVIGALFALALAVVSGKLGILAVLGTIDPGPQAQAVPPAAPTVRADIVDRNGHVLATSVATASLFGDPSKIIDAPDAARQLSKLFPDMTYGELLGRLQATNKDKPGEKEHFIWLYRHLTPGQQRDVDALGIPGIGFRPDERRVYPEGSEASQLIGYTDINNKGQAGVEAYFDSDLALGTEKVQLSIDIRLQHMMHREVEQQVAAFDALGGGGLIMDTRTGEILAMVSLPDFNPELHDAPSTKDHPVDPDPYLNRMTRGVYEMGSIFKVFNTALALDSGKVRLSDYFDATHPLKIARFTIDDDRDDRLRKWASVAEIFEKSSNIGSVQMVKQVGPVAQEAFMRKLGMTSPLDLEVPELGTPLYPHPWRPINMMTIAFGHGISITPVQLVSGVSAIANGGILRPATLRKLPDDQPVPGIRVISPATSEIMRRLMRLVVTSGTGRKVNVPGYLVGGKTGTAEKVSAHGGYKKRHGNLSSFIGLFPMTDPRYAVFVTIDEPHGNKQSFGYETAAWTAAPAVARIIAAMGPMLGMPPVDEQSPVVQAKMEIDTNPGGRRVSSD
jgi:cell division protein FtsI (penicillin-binding protein 3)